jgi:protein-disulfide isomerase
MKIPGVCSTLTTVLLLCMSAFSQSASTSAPATSTAARQTVSRSAAAKQSAASAPKAEAKLPTEQTVNEFMRRMFGYDSSIRWKVLQITPSEIPNVAQVTVSVNDQQRPWTLYTAPDGQHAFVGELIPFGADPFAVARKEMEVRAKGPARGPQNAPVTIVEFSDLQCPHCKQAQPTLEKLISEAPNARLVFENFPIDQIHKWANLAARYGSCVGRTNGDAFWRFIDGVFNEQDQITEQNATDKLNEIAKAAGADPEATATCAAAPQAKTDVIQSYELGVANGVTGTPTLFINGRKIANVNSIPYDQLKAIVQFEAQQAGK